MLLTMEWGMKRKRSYVNTQEEEEEEEEKKKLTFI